jgi:hypothetical protein
LTEDHHVAGIAPELRDVVSDPMQGSNKIEETSVARTREIGSEYILEMAMSKDPEAVVDTDENDIASPGETRAVVKQARAAASFETAPMQPHEDRSLVCIGAGRPDVEAQAIFAHVRPLARPSTFRESSR